MEHYSGRITEPKYTAAFSKAVAEAIGVQSGKRVVAGEPCEPSALKNYLTQAIVLGRVFAPELRGTIQLFLNKDDSLKLFTYMYKKKFEDFNERAIEVSLELLNVIGGRARHNLGELGIELEPIQGVQLLHSDKMTCWFPRHAKVVMIPITIQDCGQLIVSLF